MRLYVYVNVYVCVCVCVINSILEKLYLDQLVMSIARLSIEAAWSFFIALFILSLFLTKVIKWSKSNLQK